MGLLLTLNINSLLIGCPYKVRGLKFVRIFERRAMFSTTVNNRHFENFMPLSRHRCVESPHPTSSAPTNLYRFRRRIISAPTYFERSETNPSVSASPIQLPCRGAESRRTKFAPTVGKTSFSEDFMPPTRQRCVESPHPTRCESIKSL